MRFLPGLMVLTAMAGSAAAASSILVAEPVETDISPSMLLLGGEAGRTSSPSIVALGEPDASPRAADAGPRATKPSSRQADPFPSVIALGGPAPAVTSEKVSAIPLEKPGAPALPAMVIRGGLIGDAFSEPVPAEPAAQAEAGEGGPPDGGAQNGPASGPAIIEAPKSVYR